MATGYVKAQSAPEAVARLKASGLTDIELHEAPDVAQLREDRKGLGKVAAARQAEFELRVRRDPGLMTVLGEVARRNRLWIVVDVGLLVAGILLARTGLALIGAAALTLTFGLPIWLHRHSRRFDRLLHAMAVGDWDEAAKLVALMRGKPVTESLAIGLEFYDAVIRLRQGAKLPAVLEDIEPMRMRLAGAPGNFESRVASLYASAGDHPGFIAAMRDAYNKAPDDPSRQTDLALAEARLGDAARAADLLAGIDLEALPVHGRPFIKWAQGLVELRGGEAQAARDTLLEGVRGFLAIPSKAALTSLALCSGACALAMQRCGEPADAQKMIAQVWPILRVYADPVLMADLRREVGLPD